MPIMYAPPIPLSGPRTISHTVKPGETLASIAARYRVSPEDLRRWNKIGRLAAGQKLTIQTRVGTGGGKAAKGSPGKPRQASKPKPVKKASN
jgi:membrane-bound lytic murein transglycosylase D